MTDAFTRALQDRRLVAAVALAGALAWYALIVLRTEGVIR